MAAGSKALDLILQDMHEFEEMQQKLLQKQDLYASEIWDMYCKLDQIIDRLENHVKRYPDQNSHEREHVIKILRDTHWKIWQLYQECPNFIVVTWNKLWHSVW